MELAVSILSIKDDKNKIKQVIDSDADYLHLDIMDGGDTNTIKQMAVDVYKKLLDKLGNPLHYSKGGEITDVKSQDDFYNLLNEAMRSDIMVSSYFKSVDLAVSKDRIFIGIYAWD